jgi:acyl-coenzyme A synthetase/AMP-(fatty) acid ligase
MKAGRSWQEVEAVLAELLQGPKYPEQDFVCHRASSADVYDMASYFYTIFAKRKDKSLPLALAAEERGVIAAALLAALASGTVLALPHSFSEGALQQMQDVSGFTSAIVDHEQKLHKPPLPRGTQLISFEPGAEKVALPVTDISADRELLRLFTGGSTGAPKIWSKSGGNLFGEALYMADRYHITNKDIIAATVTPYHIYGLLFSVLIPLVSSARVLNETPSFPAEIVTLVQQESASILVSVPAHYRVLKGRSLGPSLQQAFSSAGMLEKEDSLDFSRCNSVGVVEVYGSTETGGLATRNRAAEQEHFQILGPVEWQIKDERLYVRSPFLSPDIATNHDGFFLSGDRVQHQGDEWFSLHGRADAITKVGGVRVDLDEVRDVLQQQPNVKECVVVPFVDTSGRGNRIAALVRGDAATLNEKQIQKNLSRLLEPAALPKRIRVVSVIPVTANGKYDRAAISELLSDS